MNILEVNNVDNYIQWKLNDNLNREFFNCKLVELTNTYKVVSLDDTITYLITPLETTVINFSS